MTDLPTVEVPAAALARLVKVAQHVSRGRQAVGLLEPYPDAAARRALGELHEVCLLDIRPAQEADA